MTVSHEEEKYAAGSKIILDAISESDAWKIAGGGETVELIDKYKFHVRFQQQLQRPKIVVN